MKKELNLPILLFRTSQDWAAWLDENHDKQPGVWLKFYKKNSGELSINYAQALDEALCYGWIDGQAKRNDEISYFQRFTPRRSNSMWSKRNTLHVFRLTKAGKMKPSGIEEVKKAQADGRWDAAYDSPSKAKPTPEFLELLDIHPKAKTFFESLSKTNSYAILWRIATAKKEETRQRRMKVIIEMLEKGETFHD